MSAFAICGSPGKGKTLYATHFAYKHYKKTNKFIYRVMRYLKQKKGSKDWSKTIINNVYSNYSILLDKKKGKEIYSNLITLDDLDNRYRLLPNALVIIDEIQMFYDSEEYKYFPQNIARFFQAHRHFRISNIIVISQHPSRIVKKIRNILFEYYKMRNLVKIPIINIGIFLISIYYELEDYGKYHKTPKEHRNFDVTNKIKFIRLKNVYKRYDDCYMYELNSCKDMMPLVQFKQKYLDKFELDYIFNNNSF